MHVELTNAFGRVFIRIEYDVKNKWVYNNWIGYQTSESVMYGANTCLDVLHRFNCSKLLNDNQLVVGPWDHSTNWIALDWTPRAIDGGLTHFANVVSPEAMAKMSALEMSAKIKDMFTMRIFDNLDTAQQWLKQPIAETI